MENRRFLIAAASSGSGKTVLSCALMSAFLQKGMSVSACKCGPDYIDPMFHREVLRIPSENLDLYFCREEVLKTLFAEHTSQTDVTVIEGVMGYYDGMSLPSEKASSYDVAKTLDVPVILTVPCRGMALTVMPLILGMIEFRKDSHIKGILLNRVSAMLYPRLKKMIEDELGKRGYQIPVIGYVPEDEVFGLKSRHLGLITPQEIEGIQKQLTKAGKILIETVDLDLLLKIEGQENVEKPLEREQSEDRKAEIETETTENKTTEIRELKKHAAFLRKDSLIRIGIARDEAFCFYYKDNLELLQKLGCELVEFSPLSDRSLPKAIQGLILGGGYPELYTELLSENAAMREEVYQAVERGIPCLAECGGFMYLHEEMEGKDGGLYPMTGNIPGKAVQKEELVRFGYIELQAQRDGKYFKKGEILRGHEFHYWDSTDNGADCLAVKPDGRRFWECIHMKENLFAGYPHIHFYSNPIFAERFVQACRQYCCS